MCYHVSITGTIDDLQEATKAKMVNPESYTELYHMNGFDHETFYCVPQENPDEIIPMNWGFVEMPAIYPKFQDDNWRIEKVDDIWAYWREHRGYTLNSQQENVFDYYKTREAAYYRRCIIPVSGFYESQGIKVGKKEVKIPHLIGSPKDQYLFLAGIYNRFDEETYTAKILTTEARGLMREIHNSKLRQPAVIHPDDIEDYLNDGFGPSELREIMEVYADRLELKAHTVSRDVNKRVKSNHPDILKEVHHPEMDADLFGK
ncbi:MAG: SOS response-associated peptidase family protein [Bacteroidota bacterium]